MDCQCIQSNYGGPEGSIKGEVIFDNIRVSKLYFQPDITVVESSVSNMAVSGLFLSSQKKNRTKQ